MLEWLKRALVREGTTTALSRSDAFELHRSGNWVRAEPLLRALLADNPDDHEARYRLGDALYQMDRLQDVLPQLERAVELDGGIAAYRYKLGNALKDLDRPGEALECYRHALALDPQHAAALANTGAVLELQESLEEALEYYRRAVRVDGTLVPARRNLAMLLHRLGRLSEAVQAYQALLEVDSGSANDWYNLGNTCQALERHEDAARCYERACASDPALAAAHYSLAVTLQNLKKYPEAEAAARRATEIAPAFLPAWLSLGDILRAQDRDKEALNTYRRGLAIDPDNPELLNNTGMAHEKRGEIEQALACFERAVERVPGFLTGRNNLTRARLCMGLVRDAIRGYRDILEMDPQNVGAGRSLLMALIYEPIGNDELFKEHLAFGQRFGSGERPAPARDRHPERGKKLRIGYVSSDLGKHPIGYALAPIIRHHDRDAFELYIYSCASRLDSASRWFREQADAWHDIALLSDDAAADLIRQDRIDILVVLAGRADENRPLLAVRRPAPIQASLHDPATSGLAEMDYLIADRTMVPRRTVEKFTERVACLPTFYVHPPLEVRAPASPPASKNGWITFGSFNNPSKIGPAVVALWARVLEAVPNSKLLLKYKAMYSAPGVRAYYLGLFREHGIQEERLLLSDRPIDERHGHLDRYGDIDIALDPFPYNGTTTTFEALSMGVPVLTLLGDSMRARMSVSMLRKIGLEYLIANDEAQYVDIGRALASDLASLTRLRADLPQRIARSPLCAERSRARQLERLYRRMWAIHGAHGQRN